MSVSLEFDYLYGCTSYVNMLSDGAHKAFDSAMSMNGFKLMGMFSDTYEFMASNVKSLTNGVINTNNTAVADTASETVCEKRYSKALLDVLEGNDCDAYKLMIWYLH